MSRHLIEQTQGKWRGILVHAGISETFLTGKKGPCPICKEGKDRFRFDDKGGSGSFICSQCGSGYGIHLLQKVLGIDYASACRIIEGSVHSVASEQKPRSPNPGNVIAKARGLWEEGVPVGPATATHGYLVGRGMNLDVAPRLIRHHDRVMYLDEDGEFRGRMPAMLGLIQDGDGRLVGLHRTYLTADGRKAAVPSPRKVLGNIPEGAAVRLFPASTTLGIAEGIETALSAQQMFGMPVWAALTANNLERWQPPEGVQQVHVFGDNDKSFTGQAAAFTLAKRLRHQGFTVEASIPTELGTDWNDVVRGSA